ncbi:hypothetical protein ACQRAE_07210 [Mediterraneibacter faecis]
MRKSRTSAFLWILRIYIFVLVLSDCQLSEMQPYDQILKVVRFAMLGIIAIYDLSVQKKVKITIIFVFMILAGLVSINTLVFDGGISLVSLLLLLFAAKKQNLKLIFKDSILSIFLAHLFVVVLCNIGILSDEVSLRYLSNVTGDFFSGEYVRHSYGFLIHNQIPTSFMLLCFLYIVYRRELFSAIDTVILVIMNLVIYTYFGSRIAFALVLAAVVGVWLIKLKEKLKKSNYRMLAFISKLCYPLLCIASFILTEMYKSSNSLMLYLDLFFNHRLSMGRQALHSYGFSWLGYGTEAGTYAALDTATVDNGYIATYLSFGIIILCFSIIAYMILAEIAKLHHNGYLLLMLIFLAFENTINAHLLSYNVIPLLCILINRNDEMLSQGQSLLWDRVHLYFKRGKIIIKKKVVRSD